MHKKPINRVKDIIEYYKLNISNFEKEVGLSNNSIQTAIKRESNLKDETLNTILNRFDDISAEWLLTGNGEMLKSDSDNYKIITSSTDGVPYYENIEVSGGALPMYSDYKETPTFYINYEHFNDCTAYLPVVGDSMYPSYCSGEIVAVKEILNKDVIQWGETYFVATNGNANDLKTIKQVHYHEDESKIILRASNPNFKGDIVINKEDILHMFIVKGKIKRNQL